MKIITVLPVLFVGVHTFCLKLPKPTGRTVFLIFLMALCSTKIYAQSEDFSVAPDSEEIKQKEIQDSLDKINQEEHKALDDAENDIQIRKVRQKIERQKYWRGALIYTSIILALGLIAAVFTLNYYQGKRKPK